MHIRVYVVKKKMSNRLKFLIFFLKLRLLRRVYGIDGWKCWDLLKKLLRKARIP